MSSSLHLCSPAKLNLFLHILRQRSDGYHELQTYFQLLDIGDSMSFQLNMASQQIEVDVDMPALAQENSVLQAARLFQSATGCRLGARIQLQKTIPRGSGLGGSSSNAATTLLALNRLWNIHWSIEQLFEMSKSLGADVPVFLKGHSAWGEGIGQDLYPMPLKTKRWYLVYCPNVIVSTAKIFGHPNLTRNTKHIRIATSFVLDDLGQNDCESLVCDFNLRILNARAQLSKFGKVKMTGTGAALFCMFHSEEAAMAALRSVETLNADAYVAEALDHSDIHRQLNY